MKAFQIFINELINLVSFYKATIYSYDQTEQILIYQRKSKIPFDSPMPDGLLIKQPHFFKYKRSGKIEIRKNLHKIVFVRAVSALEVFLIDLVRDAFLESKEPFKKQDIIQPFSQAELLSLESTTEIFAKIINKECRKLSSGGFLDIIKYYKKYFDIDLGGFAPGKRKMEEYHDRRHLLVHRLGKTDLHYREKYNTTKQGITIDEIYFNECIADFKSFTEMGNNQMNYQLQNKYNHKTKKEKSYERKILILIEFLKPVEIECFDPNFEFWANDEFSTFNDILDSRKNIEENKIEFILSGSFRQIKSYLKILRRSEKKKHINLFEKEIKISGLNEKGQNLNNIEYSTRILDEEILKLIQQKLPQQPWETGIHKIVAAELNVPNKLVSLAIQQLIAKDIFCHQINGKVVHKVKASIDNVVDKN